MSQKIQPLLKYQCNYIYFLLNKDPPLYAKMKNVF